MEESISFGELASAPGAPFLCPSSNFPNQEWIPLSQNVCPFTQLTDHRRELPGVMDKVNVVYAPMEYYSAIKREF